MAETPRCHRRNRKHILTKEIPQDVIFDNILPRLPVKSLIRCLSVAKQWHSFLKSPMLANIHLNQVINDDHQNHYKLLMIYKEADARYGFNNMDCETLDCETLGPRRPLPFKVSSEDVIFIISSCNGLVLVGLKKQNYDAKFFDLILWNPLTGDYKPLPKSVSKLDDRIVFELYYNSYEEDYRFLHISYYHYDVHIYSLKSDSWRKINSKEAFPPNLDLSGYWHPSACWNKNLYFTKRGDIKYSIIRFDIETEKFTEIGFPPVHRISHSSRLTVQRGCIYMCVQEFDVRRSPQYLYRTMLWSMNINGGWNMVSTYTPYYSGSLLQPLHLMKDGNWLMKSFHYGYQMYQVDQENKHSKSACFVDFDGCVKEKYMETFVSPNQYMN